MIEIYTKSHAPGTINDDLYIVDFPSDMRKGTVFRNLEVSPEGTLVFVQHVFDMGTEFSAKPILTADPRYIKELVQAFMEYSLKTGIRPPTESKLAGTLEATQSHLKDMQRIVFKDYDQKS